MQKLAGSVPRPALLSGVLCGRYAVGLCRKRQDRLSFAQAGENASGCPPARRARLAGDCSSLSPLTLKPLRSPTPCPFTAIATALLSGYAAHAAARSMVTATVAAGLGLPRRQPSTMSAGCFLGFDTCGAPPPSRSLRGWLCRQRQEKRRGFASVSAACFLSSCAGGGKVAGVGKSSQRQKHPHQCIFGRAVQLPPN